ncbi:MAG: hypothetical protein MUP02_04705, partial [Actinobacteria bacterium]|nr:hypothetical protein [Actinomycetota bacterium]
MLRRIKKFYSRRPFRNKAMVLIIVSFLILFLVVDFYIYGMHARNLDEVSARSLEHSIDEYNYLKESDIKTLSAIMEVLLEDKEIKSIYLEGDREKLYDRVSPFYKKIKE